MGAPDTGPARLRGVIHPAAIVEPDARIGSGTRVWAFCHILGGATIGRDCNICDHVFIESGVTVGDRVTIKSGVQLWSGVTLEADVFIGPNATFTNDRFPRSRDHPDQFARITVRKGATVGANATIVADCTIGTGAMVGAGAVVTRDVPPHAIVVGNPARISGYSSATEKGPIPVSSPTSESPLAVEGARTIHLPVIEDLRGRLSFGEGETHLPFLPRRYFVVYDVPSREVRGEHAHRRLQQVLVCLRGSVEVMIDNGRRRDLVTLAEPSVGLYVPPMTWLSHYGYSPNALLLVLASDPYDANDYVRDYDEFLRLLSA